MRERLGKPLARLKCLRDSLIAPWMFKTLPVRKTAKQGRMGNSSHPAKVSETWKADLVACLASLFVL